MAYFFSDSDGLRILSELLGDKSRSIRQIELVFQQKFPQAQQFKVGCTLCMLLKEGSLSIDQRIAALSILCDIFRLREPPKRYRLQSNDKHDLCNNNPFIAFLYEYLNSLLNGLGSKNSSEIKYLKHLLNSPGTRDSMQCTASELQSPPLSLSSSWGDVDMKDIRVVHNIDAHYCQEAALVQKSMALAAEIPPSLTASPSPNTSTSAAINTEHPLAERFATSLTTALTPSQQNSLISALKSTEGVHTELLKRVKFCPEQLKDMIEFNPNLAVECLAHLLSDPNQPMERSAPATTATAGNSAISITSPILHPYLTALLSVDLSLQSMEVVNRLTTSNMFTLPRSFFAAYCCSCINTCENIKDKYSASRLVRIVCVFVQSLIRNKIVTANDKDLLVVIETFTIEFSKIKEASTLYRLLKEM